MKPVIITDIDGVVLKWQSMLPYFAQKYGICLDKILEIQYTEEFKHTSELFHCHPYVAQKLKREYHESEFMRYLSAYDDALKFINDNKNKYDFVAVTALEPSENTYKNRMFNLNTLFPGAFSQIILTGNDKRQAISDVYINAASSGQKVIAYCDDLVEHCHSAMESQNELLDQLDLKDFISGIEIFHFIRGKRVQDEEHFHTVNSWNDVGFVLNGI